MVLGGTQRFWGRGGVGGMGKVYYLTINQTHGTKETTKVYLVLDYSFL